MDWNVALEMVILSHAAYDDDDSAMREWYDYVNLIKDDYTDTEAYLLANPEMRVLAIRGSDSWRDWICNLSICLVCRQGRHKGFDRAAEGLFNKPEFAEWLAMPGPIYITGHSKGGAIGQILTLKIDRVEALFAFGAPKAGTRRFCREYRQRGTPTYLFANDWDLIAQAPPAFIGYRRTSKLRYLDGKGHAMTGYLDEIAKKV